MACLAGPGECNHLWRLRGVVPYRENTKYNRSTTQFSCFVQLGNNVLYSFKGAIDYIYNIFALQRPSVQKLKLSYIPIVYFNLLDCLPPSTLCLAIHLSTTGVTKPTGPLPGIAAKFIWRGSSCYYTRTLKWTRKQFLHPCTVADCNTKSI